MEALAVDAVGVEAVALDAAPETVDAVDAGALVGDALTVEAPAVPCGVAPEACAGTVPAVAALGGTTPIWAYDR